MGGVTDTEQCTVALHHTTPVLPASRPSISMVTEFDQFNILTIATLKEKNKKIRNVWTLKTEASDNLICVTH